MMRKFLITMGIAVAAANAGTAVAQTQFDITGEIDPGTCQWAVGDDDRTIILDTIDASVLNVHGSGNFKAFNLILRQCTPGMSGVTFTFAGTPDTNDPLRFLNTGSAKGTAIELESADGLNIGADGTNNSRAVSVKGSDAVMALRAGYWRVGAVAAGSVSSIATVTVTYQ
jgi:type 1 fimbria pilin